MSHFCMNTSLNIIFDDFNNVMKLLESTHIFCGLIIICMKKVTDYIFGRNIKNSFYFSFSEKNYYKKISEEPFLFIKRTDIYFFMGYTNYVFLFYKYFLNHFLVP